MRYSGENALRYVFSLIKAALDNKVDKVSGKGLSSNDFTDTLLTKLNGLSNYVHPTTAGNKHIPSGGSSGNILKYGGSSGTATWGSETSLSKGNAEGEGNAITDFKVSGHQITPVKGSSFLTEHPNVTVADPTTGTNTLVSGGTFDAIDQINRDKNGHVTSYRKVTHTLPTIPASSSSRAFDLLAASWSGSGPYTYTLSVSGITANTNGVVGLSTACTDAQYEAASEAKIRITGQTAGQIILTAIGTKPTVTIPIVVDIMD